ncbi:MAG: long-chain fatty acid--CoA ligase [Acidobacteria bacterium]|nr:MAG: long-chain fatty acid--CoA ligase [Acidobacteriota bacterium]REK04016.1 MAG: long-chain fatty acid--CoA ligase [Acidobacteriota bacterium]REK15178.1 MAG: long-chain fatty acid--CoA ligase [Acidobacteriota bacterium]REK46268.1 MAG: long-chain fatty acid--CoA ligase [Acidobacteriota bacterium]
MANANTLNLASIIEHQARLAPEKEAIVWADVRMSYGELNAFANRVAHALNEMGIGIGDKVALSCPNLPYFPIVYYGILKAGAAVVPLNVLFKPREIAYHLEDSDAKAIFVFEGTEELPMGQMVKEGFDQVDSCEHLVVMTADKMAPSPVEGHRTLTQLIFDKPDTYETVATDPLDTCAILYTSGTTGKPKGAELTHLNLFTNISTTYNIHLPKLDFTTGEQMTCLITLPLFHTTGQNVQMNTNMFAGNRCVLLPRFDPAATLDAMEKERVNFWIGVPTMYWAVLQYVKQSGRDVSKIKEFLTVPTSGGAPMPVEVMREFGEMFGVRILEGYGLSETSPLATFNHFDRPSKPGTVGQPIQGVDVKCFDDDDNEVPAGERGEIVIRGPNIMKGYYKRPEATAEAFRSGWFHSGDIGIIDEDGYVQIVDRKKDMILRGGYNVYPRELEEVIMTHPAVSLVAVIAVPDEKLGEEVKAFVVLNEGEELSEDEFINWCKEQFAANKYPRYVEFRDELPIGGTGKIHKLTLKQEVRGEQ